MIRDKILKEIREIRINTERELEKKGISYSDYLLELQEKYRARIVEPVKRISKEKKWLDNAATVRPLESLSRGLRNASLCFSNRSTYCRDLNLVHGKIIGAARVITK